MGKPTNMSIQLKKAYLSQQLQFATELTQLAQSIFSKAFELAKEWNLEDEDMIGQQVSASKTPIEAIEAPTPPPVEAKTPLVTPPPAPGERPSERLRKRRAARAQAAEAAPKALMAPTSTIQQEGLNKIPLNMEPLPDYRVFEAMFNKKYGPGHKCTISLQGQVSEYTAQELYEFLGKVYQAGNDANDMLRAVYGTVMSLVMDQHGREIDYKDMN